MRAVAPGVHSVSAAVDGGLKFAVPVDLPRAVGFATHLCSISRGLLACHWYGGWRWKVPLGSPVAEVDHGRLATNSLDSQLRLACSALAAEGNCFARAVALTGLRMDLDSAP